MRDQIASFSEEIHSMINGPLYKAMKTEIRNETLDFESVEKELRSLYKNHKADPFVLAEKKKQVLKHIEQSWTASQGETIEEFATDYATTLDNLLEHLPDMLIIPQENERFHAVPGDLFILKLSKAFKKFFFSITRLPARFLNLFRKKKKPIHYWSHQVPFKSIATLYFKSVFLKKIYTIRRSYYRPLSAAYQQLKEWEETTMNDQMAELDALGKGLGKTYSKVRKGLKEQLLKASEESLKSMENDLQKVNTIELSSRRFEPSRVAKKVEKAAVLWKTEDKEWHNTFDAFFEEWRSDLEIQRLICVIKSGFENYKKAQEKNLDEYIEPELKAIESFIQESLNLLEKKGSNIGSVLIKQNYKAKKELDQEVVPTLIEKLGSKNMVNSLASLESQIRQEMENLSEQRKISKIPTDYQEPIPNDEITTISPFELIEFEIIPALTREMDQLKSVLFNKFGENIVSAQDLDHTITFALTTASDQLTDNPDDSETALKVAIESLQRTLQRVNEIRNSIQQLTLETNDKLNEQFERYYKELFELTVNENVRQIRMRIMRAKAIQQSTAYRTVLIGLLKTKLDDGLKLIKENWVRFIEFKNKVSQRFILTSKKEPVSREISDFLTESQQLIQSLPIIYRNLYRIQPINDIELFVGRVEEYEQLEKAYINWQNGRMGSAVLVGEKWSGLTSFVNYIQHQKTFKHAINRMHCVTSFTPELQLLEYFRKLLNTPDLNSFDELADRLNEGPKRVIIIEDIQNLYLKHVGGFRVLSEFMELVSKTLQNIFWITTCTLYTWEYFIKTMGIQDIFSYCIYLKQPGEKVLEEIVKKRNRISGYKIVFEPSDEESVSKKFQKMPEEEQQKYLSEKFFSKLISFAESNISMALMYWLLSTKSVDVDKIIISTFRAPDMAFLSALSMDKVITLHQLILHDGLSVSQFALVNRYSKQSAFLILSMLLEDGILIQKEASYLVNPLVYRSVIALLKSKNLIN